MSSNTGVLSRIMPVFQVIICEYLNFMNLYFQEQFLLLGTEG